MRNFWHKHQKVILHYVIPAICCVAALGVVGFLVFGDETGGSKRDVDAFVSESTLEQEAQTRPEIPVYVTGGVASPGVYWLLTESLIQDAITAAGGLAKECDVTAMEKTLNLADQITEGMKIYVPKIGDNVAAGGNTNSDGDLSKTSGKTNINIASKSQLMDLSGIGEVYSQKIIDGRPYKAIKDLVDRKIIPSATYEKIKDQITV